jgi:tripartite-type tricarboxylate transporter receptor subunit TctC
VDVLADAVKRATESDDVKKKFADLTLPVRYEDPSAYAAEWAATETMVKPLLAELGQP